MYSDGTYAKQEFADGRPQLNVQEYFISRRKGPGD